MRTLTPNKPTTGGIRWRQVAALSATGFVVVAAIWAYANAILGPNRWLTFTGIDFETYVEAARRFMAGGSWYLDRQLHGPYSLASGDILFPPLVAPFFLAWTILPAPIFWLAPVAFLAWFAWRVRPATWTWPIIACCLAYPNTVLRFIAGNPDAWIAATVAAGLLWRWPGALALLKPSVLPFALVGIRSRGWWVAATVIAIAMVPFVGAYAAVVLDARGGGLVYSITSLPILVAPLIAWMGRTSPREKTKEERGTIPDQPAFATAAREGSAQEDAGGSLRP